MRLACPDANRASEGHIEGVRGPHDELSYLLCGWIRLKNANP